MARRGTPSNFYDENKFDRPFRHGHALRRRGAPPYKREQISGAEVAHGPAQREIFAQFNYAHTHQHEAEQWPLFGNGRDEYVNDRNFRGLAPKGYSRSDARIGEDVCELLMHAPDIDASDIAVDVQAGMVILSGTVIDRRQKYRAELITDAVRGVRDIDNRLTLQRSQTTFQDS